MKKLHLIAWIVFLLGLTLRLFHFPGSSLLLILGTLLLLIHGIIFLFKNAKTNLPFSFLHLSFSFLTVYLLFRVQYWDCGPMIAGYTLLFILVFCLTLTCLILNVLKRTKIQMPQIALTIYFGFFMILSFSHSDRIYYFFNLNTVLNGESRNQDFYSWDKYSWFLYLADKQDEAIEANLNAQKAADEYLKITQDDEAIQFSALIKQHQQQISGANWTSYP